MEGRDLVLTGKPFTAHKYRERNRPAITPNWLPARITIPTSVHDPRVTSSRTRPKDKSSVKSRARPHSACSLPGRKSFASTRPTTGLSVPMDHTALLSTRDCKHSARIDLTTAQAIDANTLTATSEPYLMASDKSEIKEETKNSLKVNNYDSKSNCKQFSNGAVHQDYGSDKQAMSAIRIQRWYRKIRSNRLENSQQLVQELLQQKRDNLNKSRITELEKVETQARELSQAETDQQKRRAIKAQKARQAAIESLRLKREERKQEVKRIAEQEILMLQSSGKVARKKVRPASKSSNQKPGSHQNGDTVHTASSTSATNRPSSNNSTGVSPANKTGATLPAEVEQIFEANCHPRQLHHHLAPPTKAAEKEASTNNHVTTGRPQGKVSIYDNLLDTLKLLEEDPEPLRQTEKGYLSAANLHKLDQTSVVNGIVGDAANDSLTSKANSVGLNETKMQNILSFLDEMEKADNETISLPSLSEDQLQTRGLPTNRMNGQSSTVEKTAEAVAADVTTTIMAQRLELEDKNKSIMMLQKALAQQREMTVYHAKEHEKESERRLGLQKQEYESTIKRHLSFIDQLIDDKKILSEKCEKLVKEVKDLDKKSSQKIKALEEKHTLELTKQKEVAIATEKLRRERWIAEQSKKIKEITVKGLEPEIQRLIAKHKAEVQKIKVLHEAELLQADERASRRFIQQTEELRSQLSAEKEAACSHERELAKQRYEKMAEQEEMANQQQRKRLYQEVQLEKERLSSTFQQKQKEMEQHFANMEVTSSTAMAELRAEHEKVLGEIQRRHASELKDLREKLQIEKEAWEENFMKKQDAVLMARQRELQEQLRQQRDKEIEMVIGRLEEESTAAREECDRNAEARIKRIREKYETELKEVERSERSTLEKFNTMKEELVVAQGEATRLRSLLRQREVEVEQVNEVVSKLNRERDNISDIVRQEFADRLVYTEEENKSLKTELSELRARHKIELERVQKEKEKEMEQVHDRVKQAVAKKDEAMKSLRTQHEAALKRADHLEMLLERQRKELLKK